MKTSIIEHQNGSSKVSTFSHTPQTKRKVIQLHFRVDQILLLLIQYNSSCSYTAALRIVQQVWRKNQAFFHKIEAIRSVWGMHLSTSETLNVSTNIQIGNKMEHRKNLLGNRKQSLQMGPLILLPFRKTICIKKKKKRNQKLLFVCVSRSLTRSRYQTINL